MDEIKKRREEFKKELFFEKEEKKPSFFHRFFFSFLSRTLITMILTLLVFIALKGNKNFSQKFYQLVFETNFSFASVNKWYEKHFGSSLPFQNLWKEKEVSVFKQSLAYTSISKYLDGANLEVEENYMVPILGSGLVIFSGEKEGYGNTVIIQQSDGVDVWYGNLDSKLIKLYDYVEEGSLLGEVHGNLYLVFKKGATVLNFEDYL